MLKKNLTLLVLGLGIPSTFVIYPVFLGFSTSVIIKFFLGV